MGAFCGLVIPMSPGLSRSAFAQRERPSIDDLRKRMADTTDSTYRVGEIVEVYSLFDET